MISMTNYEDLPTIKCWICGQEFVGYIDYPDEEYECDECKKDN